MMLSLLLLAALPPVAPLLAVHGELHERLERVNLLLEEEPDAPRLLLKRAQLHREHGDWTAAAVDLARAAEAAPQLEGLDLEAALLAAASGRAPLAPSMRHVGPAPANPVAAAVAFVDPGATWKYKDDGITPSGTWRQLGFNDGAWASGPAELGYGDGDEATVVSFGPNASQVHPTTWFRHSFQGPLTNPQDLSIALRCDDGAIVYLNGTEVARFNLPAQNVSAATWALANLTGSEERLWRWYAVDPQLLSSGTNVLAVEVHQASATSSDISFDLGLAPVPPPRLARGPWLQTVSTDAATVSWRTVQPFDSEVAWGLAPGQLNNVVSVPGTRYDHEVRITGLPTDATVYYSVGRIGEVFAGDDADHAFRTAPPAGTRKLRAWVLGDSGIAGTDQEAVRDAYLALEQAEGVEADFLLMLGDNAYPDGTESDYQAAFFDSLGDILRRMPVWSTLGNHDAPSLGVYTGIFAPPTQGECGGLPSGTEAYYSWDWGDVHFVCLDSMLVPRSANGPMATWLEQDLAQSDARFTIVYFHHPPYTKGNHDSDDIYDSGGRMQDMRENLLPILEAGGADVVLSGHTHAYERSHLLHGHYGFSWELLPSHIVQSGRPVQTGDLAYRNDTGPGSGTVYVVSGGSSKTAPGTFDHAAMPVGGEWLGSLVLEVDGDRLDMRFLDHSGAIGDHVVLWTGDPPPELWVSPLVGGGTGTVRLLDGLPGAPFWVWTGTGPGSTAVPQGVTALAPPVALRFSGTFGASGQYSVSAAVPAALSGRTVALQAAQAVAPGQVVFGDALLRTVQ